MFPIASLQQGFITQHFGFVLSPTTNGTAVTPGNGSKSGWVKLPGSPDVPLAFDGAGITVCLDPFSLNNILGDIGFGPDSSNVSPLVPNAYFRSPGDSRTDIIDWFVPIRIPRKNFMWVRGQADAAAQTLRAACVVHAGSQLTPGPYSKMVSWGIDFTNSKGLQIDPGGTASTWGSWIVMTQAAEFNVGQLSVVIRQDNSTAGSGLWSWQVGVGGSGSEISVLHDPQITQDATHDDISGDHVLSLPKGIPRGSRVALRAMSTITSSPDRLLHGAIYALG